MSNAELVAGSKSPVAVRVTITTADPTLDMRTIVSCNLGRKAPNGTLKNWTTVIDSATQNTIVVIHELAEDRSDIPDFGGYVLFPTLTTASGGEVPCEAIDLPVDDPYAV